MNIFNLAIFLVDAYHDVYLWFGWWSIPNGDENVTRIGAADARWIKNKKLAIETAFNYCKGTISINRKICILFIVIVNFRC